MDDIGFLSCNPTALQPWKLQPKQAYILEVGIDTHGKKILIGYTEYWTSPEFKTADPHQEFLAWANALIAKPTAGEKLTFHSKPSKRKPTKMSFRCKDLVYLVFKLDDKIDWRFTVDGPAVSMDGIWSGKDVFFAPKKAGELANGRTYAYAIANCPNGTLDPSSSDIEARFNLHVDFLEGGETDAYTPVIIDPDVRYPGGNGNP